MDISESQRCTRCTFTGAISSFPLGRGMKRLKTCTECTKHVATYRAERRGTCDGDADKENHRSKKLTKNQPGTAIQPLERMEMSMDDILDLLRTHKESAFELDVIANLEEFINVPNSQDTQADTLNASITRQISKAVWEATGYRYM